MRTTLSVSVLISLLGSVMSEAMDGMEVDRDSVDVEEAIGVTEEIKLLDMELDSEPRLLELVDDGKNELTLLVLLLNDLLYSTLNFLLATGAAGTLQDAEELSLPLPLLLDSRLLWTRFL